MANFAADGYVGCGLKIVLAEDAHRIERVKFRRVGGAGESGRKIKAFDRGMKIGRIESHDLGVLARWFREQIRIGGDQVGELHAIAIGVTAGAQDMTLEVNSLIVVWRDREDVDAVAVMNLEGAKL